MKDSHKLAILFSLLSALFLALTGAFAKGVSVDVPVSVVLLARFFVCLLMVLPWIIVSKKRLWITDKPMHHLLRGFLGFSSIACFFYSLRFISLANAMILSYTIPLFIPFLVLIFYRVKISYHALVYLLIGFVGVILIIQPQSDNWHFAYLIALGSGLFGAAAILSIRELTHTENALTIMFYYYLFATGLSILWVLENILGPMHPTWHFTGTTWLMLAGVGIMGALYQLFLTYSLKLASAQVTTPFLYISVIFSLLAEWAIWGTTPTLVSGCGIILAAIGAIASSRLNRQPSKPMKETCNPVSLE